MKRSDGAKAWSTVLSELAQVRVAVELDRLAAAASEGPVTGLTDRRADDRRDHPRE